MLLDLISYFDTAPGSSGGAAAAVSGDSLTIKNATDGSGVWIARAWGKNQTEGWDQIVFPSGNDTSRNIRATVDAASPIPLWNRNIMVPVVPNETLTITIAGSGTGGDVELGHALILYEDLPGQAGRYISPDEVSGRFVRFVTVEFTLTISNGGAYDGEEAINAESDLLKPNRDYALLGANLNTLCGCIAIQGPDNSLARLGIPGIPGRPDLTANFFGDLSRDLGRDLVPVIAKDNASNIFLTGVQDEDVANIQGSLNLVELAQ